MRHPKLFNCKDEDYLNYIRDQECCIPGCECHGKSMRSDPHHLWHAKNNDYMAVPLCRPKHILIGTMPVKEFEEKHNVNLSEEALYYLFNYGGFKCQQ